jgi:hypothetical protein
VRRSERKIGRVGEGVGEVAIEEYRGLDMSKCSVEPSRKQDTETGNKPVFQRQAISIIARK